MSKGTVLGLAMLCGCGGGAATAASTRSSGHPPPSPEQRHEQAQPQPQAQAQAPTEAPTAVTGITVALAEGSWHGTHGYITERNGDTGTIVVTDRTLSSCDEVLFPEPGIQPPTTLRLANVNLRGMSDAPMRYSAANAAYVIFVRYRHQGDDWTPNTSNPRSGSFTVARAGDGVSVELTGELVDQTGTLAVSGSSNAIACP